MPLVTIQAYPAKMHWHAELTKLPAHKLNLIGQVPKEEKISKVCNRKEASNVPGMDAKQTKKLKPQSITNCYSFGQGKKAHHDLCPTWGKQCKACGEKNHFVNKCRWFCDSADKLTARQSYYQIYQTLKLTQRLAVEAWTSSGIWEGQTYGHVCTVTRVLQSSTRPDSPVWHKLEGTWLRTITEWPACHIFHLSTHVAAWYSEYFGYREEFSIYSGLIFKQNVSWS